MELMTSFLRVVSPHDASSRIGLNDLGWPGKSYMRELKYSIDNNGHGLIEMPCGTGKTITILSFLIAYKRKRPDIINKIGQGFSFFFSSARWLNCRRLFIHGRLPRTTSFRGNPSKLYHRVLLYCCIWNVLIWIACRTLIKFIVLVLFQNYKKQWKNYVI